MTKQPFTPDGFEELQLELHQLTDVELQHQAEQIDNDFITWMISKFELTTSQVIFLSEIKSNNLAFITAQTKFAVVNRLPVILEKPDEISSSKKDQGKVIKSKNSLRASVARDGSSEASGTLTIQIEYL